MERHFEYRVVHKESNGFAVYTLFADKSGNYHFVGTLPSSPWGMSVDQIQSDMDKFQEAINKPVIQFTQIK